MAKVNKNSPNYKAGYNAGYKAGGRMLEKVMNIPRAYWIMRKGDWYCSRCNTKHEQVHHDFCCKCGAKMSEEADYEDN